MPSRDKAKPGQMIDMFDSGVGNKCQTRGKVFIAQIQASFGERHPLRFVYCYGKYKLKRDLMPLTSGPIFSLPISHKWDNWNQRYVIVIQKCWTLIGRYGNHDHGRHIFSRHLPLGKANGYHLSPCAIGKSKRRPQILGKHDFGVCHEVNNGCEPFCLLLITLPSGISIIPSGDSNDRAS